VAVFLHILPIYLLCVLSIISPGPDFLLVTRQALAHGRVAGIWCSFGIAMGVVVHISYCLLGLGWVIAQSVVVFSVMKFAAALYLIYLGYEALRGSSAPQPAPESADLTLSDQAVNGWKCFRQGFITNLLNPKAALFFVSLFTVVMRAENDWDAAILLSMLDVGTIFVWFSLLSIGLGHAAVQRFFYLSRRWLDRITGVLLIGLGIKVATLQHQS
jgi:RhtB (resistance to homoserine/threonine) family protein